VVGLPFKYLVADMGGEESGLIRVEHVGLVTHHGKPEMRLLATSPNAVRCEGGCE
jgi:hypothetical protein